jgi:hypothetical protein
MTRMGWSMTRALVLLACACGAALRADTVAIDVSGPICASAAGCAANQPFNYSQGSYLLGFAFRVNSAISITQLGF